MSIKSLKNPFLFIVLFFLAPLLAHADGPTISAAADITAEATNATGAAVTYTLPTATDATGTPVTVSCDPASGSIFALGTTTVNCSASDSLFATSTSSFAIGVVDTTAPSITLPSHTIVATTSLDTLPSPGLASATDTVDSAPTLTHTPASLGAGNTDIVWTARDVSGNESSATTTYTVLAPIDVTVPDTCTVVDNASTTHLFEISSTTPDHETICALEAAKESGAISSFSVGSQSFGLYLESIDGVTPGATEYWALWHNDDYASCGVGCETVQLGDVISFVLTDWQANTESAQHAFALHIIGFASTTANTSSNTTQIFSGGSNPYATPATFDVQKALTYLAAHQNADGSFSSPLVSDWAAIAFASANPSVGTTLKAYLTAHGDTLDGVTDNERRAMALEALGINPYSGTGRDYITPIVTAFDGTQIGSTNQDNDDIFALIALSHAGYGASDPMMQKVAASVIAAQKADGSWDASVDMTAAAIQAIGPFYMVPGYGKALGMGVGYLTATQQQDGGWDNTDSTSWVMTMMTSVAEGDPAHAPTFTTSSGKKPADALAVSQQSDGGVASSGDRVWSTAYAITAASGKSWLSALQNFSKPAPTVGGSNPYATTTVSVASSTASTTPAFDMATTTATSTQNIAPKLATTTPTTTPAFSSPAVSTTPVVRHIAKRPLAPKPHLAATTTTPELPAPASQTAAAASTETHGFWGWVVSLWRRWF